MVWYDSLCVCVSPPPTHFLASAQFSVNLGFIFISIYQILVYSHRNVSI